MSLTKKEKLEAIKKLDKALEDVCFSKDEAYEILREAEIEPEKAVNKHLENIKKLYVLAQIKNAKNKRGKLDLLDLAKQKIKQYQKKFESAPKDLLAQLFKGKLGFQFRKLEELSDNDAIEMLEEAQLLKLIKELDRNTYEQ